MEKSKKPGRFYKSFSGEYMGIGFQLQRRKLTKREYGRLKEMLGKRPSSKVEYRYNDSDVTRVLDKKQYDNLINNSEILYDEKKGKKVHGPWYI